jgi:hypothetical protein
MRLSLLLLCLASSLVGQSVRARLEGRVPAGSVPVLDSLVAVAAAEGLPTEPLIQKAIEGGAKHVSGERIVKAVALNIEQLRQAQALLVRAGDAPPATVAEVTAVASALKRGLAAPLVERIVAALPDQPRSSAFHALADLAAHRFNPDSAADLILAAVGKGVRGLRLLDVSGAAIQELQRGRSHAEALAQVRAKLPNVPAAPTPARSAVQGARRPAMTAQGP